MFASLHRADGEIAPENGRSRFLLTDHRDAPEIEASRELSIVFALVRVLRTQRLDDPTPIVVYYLPSEPPDFLVEAVASAGGRVTFGEDPRAWVDVTERGAGRSPRPVEEILNEAMAGLARRTAAEAHLSLDLGGLQVFEKGQIRSDEEEEEEEEEEEDEISVDVKDDEEEEEDADEDDNGDGSDGGEAKWTSVVKVASFAGEVLRQRTDGRWIVKRDGDSAFPMVFECKAGDKELVANLLAKGEKLRRAGIEDSLALLVSAVVQILAGA